MNGKHDLVILDVSLPDGSGYDLCRKIFQSSKVPIIFLTAADEETDIIMGLDMGGVSSSSSMLGIAAHRFSPTSSIGDFGPSLE